MNQQETTLEVENFGMTSGGSAIAGTYTAPVPHTVGVVAHDTLDLNRDGVVGVGDLVLAADDATREAIASVSAIYPYKRAMILTIDGMGTPFNENWLYYSDRSGTASYVKNETSARNNPYLMDLFYNEWAISHTATATGKFHSGENYTSILHGEEWNDMPIEYKVDNTISGVKYWPDYGKAEAVYPSIFAVLHAERPGRTYAAFSEWTNIQNGIIEPDVPMYAPRYSASGTRSFAALQQYIEDGHFRDTTLVFLQDDKLDSIGHNSSSAYGTNGGYYGSVFWEEMAKYDGYYKGIIDALKAEGLYDDTLIVTNADHGGNGTTHDSNNSLRTGGKIIDGEVFIAIGGQTVNPGAQLSGGSNKDVSGIILEALRVEKPESMKNSEVFDSLFLTQEELAASNKSGLAVTLTQEGYVATLAFAETGRDIRAVDAVIDLTGWELEAVVSEGSILRQEMASDGRLALTVLFDGTPTEMAKLVLKPQVRASTSIQAEEVMLATADGNEIYPALANEERAVSLDDLNAAIAEAEAMTAAGGWVEDVAYDAFTTLIAEAKTLAGTLGITSGDIADMIARLESAKASLTPVVIPPDLAGLLDAIEEAEVLLTAGGWWEDDAFTALGALAREARALAEAPAPSADAVDEMIERFFAARAALSAIPSEADYQRLAGIVIDALGLIEKEYWVENTALDAYRALLTKAQAMATAFGVTPGHIASMLEQLATARAALTVAGPGELATSTPTTPGGSTTTSSGGSSSPSSSTTTSGGSTGSGSSGDSVAATGDGSQTLLFVAILLLSVVALPVLLKKKLQAS